LTAPSRSDPVTSCSHGLPANGRLDEWTNRLLLVSLLGIAALTLFPFRFDFSRVVPGNTPPFLLGPLHKDFSLLDIFLNVLLFVPWGFALSTRFRLRQRSWLATFALAVAGGAICSYLVEFLQIYIPGRESGWEDVVTNSAGAMVGFFVFAGWGSGILRSLSNMERVAEHWLSPLRVLIILVSYLMICFAGSVSLQKKTELTDWDSNCFFLLGGDRSGRHPWKGKIFSLQIWDHALSGQAARSLTAGGLPEENSPDLLASYDFSTALPFQDEKHLLPELLLEPRVSVAGRSGMLELNGKVWLASKAPVSALVRRLKSANQFALRILCAPAQVQGADGHIVSIGEEARVLDLRLRQEGDALVIWLLTPLSAGPGNLVWTVPHAFAVNQVRSILISYDGSSGYAYIDGVRMSPAYRLSPGAGLLQLFKGIGTEDLGGDIIAYDAMLFLPLGLLLGMAARKIGKRKLAGWLCLASGIVFPSLLLEMLLIQESGRVFSVQQTGYCAGFCLLGLVLINADRGVPERAVECNES
jgi:glycopeptide antibiotics resistance protein